VCIRWLAIEHALLLGREAELIALAVQGIDPAEQRLVHEDAVPVLGLQRRQGALDLLDRVIGVRAGQHAENVGNARKRVTTTFERVDRVGKRGRSRVGADGLDLRLMRGKRPLEGGQKMLRSDRTEWRDAERSGPCPEERVVVAG